MTAQLSEATRRLVESHDLSSLSGSVGVVVAALLIVLLVEVEVVRALGSRRGGVGVGGLHVAAMPLLIAFAMLVVARFADLLR